MSLNVPYLATAYYLNMLLFNLLRVILEQTGFNDRLGE